MDTRKIARKIAEEAIVLLKNDGNTLPFAKNQKIAFIGRAQTETIFSGNGSGASHTDNSKKILEECEKRGLLAEPSLRDFYQEKLSKEEKTEADEFDFTKMKDVVNSGIMYEIFGKYRPPVQEYEIPAALWETAKQYTDTAVLVIGRNSGGEECDRHLHEDYYLTLSEKNMVSQTCSTFENVVVILNVNGLIDLGWVKTYPSIKSILFIGIPGEEGAAALADIMIGGITPSGKLGFTIAEKYEDYPSFKDFTWDKEHPESILTYESYGLNAEENKSRGYAKSPVTVYREGIYNGYRYFDTFEKVPLYPFGYGLSYTWFEIEGVQAAKKDGAICLTASVKNTGDTEGKEVVQAYISSHGMKSERVCRELKGFEKTKLLKPGEKTEVEIQISWKEFACYDEEAAAYVIEKGEYLVQLGNSSKDIKTVCRVIVAEEFVTERLINHLSIRECNQGKIEFLTQKGTCRENHTPVYPVGIRTFMLKEADVVGSTQKGTACERKYEEKIKILSLQELAALCVGYGPGTPFSAVGQSSDPETVFDEEGKPVTTNSHPVGVNGYVSPAIMEKGIHSVFYKDGPAGIGEMAWPTAMLTACAFDKDVWYQLGDAVGWECRKQQVDVWLAPAVNLHRHPLCGRNFEYFSEDPVLTGICACQIARGVQENHEVLVCAKHFAINEQETCRRGNGRKHYDAVDSILSERTARELYLKPFEMLVRDAGLSCIMTSFNKINGTFAGGSKDLCTGILRNEWKFEGVVVTDWGDMDVVVDGADAVAAGNDVVMPGGPPVIAQILKGYNEGRVSRKDLEKAVSHLLYMTAKAGKERREEDKR